MDVNRVCQRVWSGWSTNESGAEQLILLKSIPKLSFAKFYAKMCDSNILNYTELNVYKIHGCITLGRDFSFDYSDYSQFSHIHLFPQLTTGIWTWFPTLYQLFFSFRKLLNYCFSKKFTRSLCSPNPAWIYHDADSLLWLCRERRGECRLFHVENPKMSSWTRREKTFFVSQSLMSILGLVSLCLSTALWKKREGVPAY